MVITRHVMRKMESKLLISVQVKNNRSSFLSCSEILFHILIFKIWVFLLCLYGQSPIFPLRNFSFLLVDKAELFHNVFEGYKLRQMCESEEFNDCDNLVTQILCEKCQYMSKSKINIQIWWLANILIMCRGVRIK